jgi:hypothetical protein
MTITASWRAQSQLGRRGPQRVAVGGNRSEQQGYWEILGKVAKEDKAGWSAFFKHLKGRGLHGVRLIIANALVRLAERTAEFFPMLRGTCCGRARGRTPQGLAPRGMQSPCLPRRRSHQRHARRGRPQRPHPAQVAEFLLAQNPRPLVPWSGHTAKNVLLLCVSQKGAPGDNTPPRVGRDLRSLRRRTGTIREGTLGFVRELG